MIKSVLFALSISLLVAIQPEISLRQSSSYERERTVSAVDKDKYTGCLLHINDYLICGCE